MNYLLICDAGHKLYTAGKRTPRFLDGTQIREYEFNRPVVDKMLTIAKKYGIETFDTAPEHTEVSLKVRTDRANKAAINFLAKNPDGIVLFVSVHYNAHRETWDGSLAEGIETYHMPGSVKGKLFAKSVHAEIIKGTKQVNRGIKTANFDVLVYTTMPAILCEFGFMDDPYEAKRMKDFAFQEECAIELIDGVRKCLGIYSDKAQEAHENTPEVIPVSTVLKQGSKGLEVLKLQNILRKDGFNIIPDQDFGPLTASCVQQFQKRYKLVADKIVGPKTWVALMKVAARKYTVSYYDRQTTYVHYLKSDVAKIDLHSAKGTSKTPKEKLSTILARLQPAPDMLFNCTMFDMPTGSVLGEVFDEGIRHGYNPYDPLTFVVRKSGEMAFMHQDQSRKLKDIKDTYSFAPQMFMAGSRCKEYGNNLSKAFLTTKLEPRNGFFETKDYYVHVLVNGRLPVMGLNGVTIPQFFKIAESVGLRIGQKIENGGNLDSGYSLGFYIASILRTQTGITSRAIANAAGVYFN